jgi:phage terminase large subunit-like protein
MGSKLGRLSTDQLRSVREVAQQERERRSRERPADFFPWHRIQRFILDCFDIVDGEVRMVFVAGGNRGGKSKVAMGVLSQFLRRVSGLNKQLLTTDKYTGKIRVKDDRDPVTVWIVPPTFEKARLDWIGPQDGYGLKYWLGDLYLDHKKTPDLIFYSRPPGKTEEECYDSQGRIMEDQVDKVLIKSQDQQLESFESSEVDFVIFDEEVQSEEIWTSCRMRVGTTHGCLLMAYTPLHGLSWTYKRFWKPFVKDNVAVKQEDRCWIHAPTKMGEEGEANIVCAQMGSADNPRAKTYAREIELDRGMPEAEKAARLYGEYGYVEGALLPSLGGIDVLSPLPEHEVYVVDYLPGMKVKGKEEKMKGRIEDWWLVTDPNKSYGATLAARDTDDNIFFVMEHLEEAWPDRKHAEQFKEMERLYVKERLFRYADPGSAGAQSIVNMSSFGLDFATLPKPAGSVAASIKALRGRTYIDAEHRHPITGEKGAPRVYFYRPGLLRGGKFESELANQLSLARQTDNQDAAPDTPHKDQRHKMDLFDCARYTANLVTDMPVSGNLPPHVPGVRPDPDNTLEIKDKEEELVHPLDQDIFMPEYSWGESSWA